MTTSFTSIIRKGTQFEFEQGRYLLIVALSCPFACRSLIARQLKNLNEAIPIEIVSPIKDNGWKFDNEAKIALTTKDRYGRQMLKEYYYETDPDYKGAISVPILYDTKSKKIVNNESADLVKIFNEIGTGPDLRPDASKEKIDQANTITGSLGIFVFKAGMSNTKEEYDRYVEQVHDGLSKLESILQSSTYLAGNLFQKLMFDSFLGFIRKMKLPSPD